MSLGIFRSPSARGQAVARLLQGSWRLAPPAVTLPEEELAAVVPQVIQTGSGALAWWTLRRSRPDSSAVPSVAAVYRVHRLESFMHEVRLVETLGLLRWYEGVEPILSKGWALARLYPDAGLRPYGDFDLHVDPSRVRSAIRALRSRPLVSDWVDLHCGVPELEDRDFRELYQRSQRLQVQETFVRVLSVEDQLRLLCLHFARHGGWRPLWLCDVAAVLESLPADFDWTYFWSGDQRLTAWICVVLGLAVRLLDAQPPSGLDRQEMTRVDWIDGVILSEWGETNPGDSHTRDKRPIASYLARPWRLWQGVRRRIPNAVEAAFKMRVLPGDANPDRCRRQYSLRRVWRYAQRMTSEWLTPSLSESGVVVHVKE